MIGSRAQRETNSAPQQPYRCEISASDPQAHGCWTSGPLLEVRARARTHRRQRRHRAVHDVTSAVRPGCLAVQIPTTIKNFTTSITGDRLVPNLTFAAICRSPQISYERTTRRAAEECVAINCQCALIVQCDRNEATLFNR